LDGVSLANEFANLGSVLIFFNRLLDAMQALRKAVEIDPNSFHAWTNLAVCCQVMGDLDEAIANYQKALAIQSNFQQALDGLKSARSYRLMQEPGLQNVGKPNGTSRDVVSRFMDVNTPNSITLHMCFVHQNMLSHVFC